MVYVVKSKAGNYRKIGSSNNPEKRLKGLQTGFPFELTIEMVGLGGMVKEIFIHALFAEFRMAGEWFRIPRRELPRLRAAVERLEDGECARYLKRKGAPPPLVTIEPPKLDYHCIKCHKEFAKKGGVCGGLCNQCLKEAIHRQRIHCGQSGWGKDNTATMDCWARQDEIQKLLDNDRPRIVKRKSYIPPDHDANGGWAMIVRAYEDFSDN